MPLTTADTPGSGLSHKELKKSIKQPDGFSSATRGLFGGLAKRKAGVAIVVGLALAGGLAAALYKSKLDQLSAEGADALYRARKEVEASLKVLAEEKAKANPPKIAPAKGKEAPKAEPADVESVLYDTFDVEAKLGGPLARLREVSEKFGGTRAAYEARMELGDLHFDHGAPVQAIQWYESAAKEAKRPLDRAAAWASLGYALEDAGRPADALTALEKAMNQGEGFLKGDLLLAIARNHELMKNTEKARSTYDQILSQLPNTDAARDAEARKALLGSAQ